MAPLPLDELDSLLTDFTSAHRDRQHWILQHWPHVVEASHVTAALGAASLQRDPQQLLLNDLTS